MSTQFLQPPFDQRAWRRAAMLLSCHLLIFCFATADLFAQRNLQNIPIPNPDEELKSFIVADGFEVNLYAADPLMAKPIQMNFDAAGRLWIASSEVYPHIKPGQQANDKILVLEDADRDGRAERTTVFADGLLIPTGVVPGDGGAYVANSSELLYLKDTDGDGKADQRRVVLSGFGVEDTHHLLHTLRWGQDGCLYMNQSIYIHSHIETPYGVQRLNGGGIWRFRPETLELEIYCRGFVNPWGLHFDAWGQSFATDGAYGEGINYVFPGSVFVTAPGAKRIMAGLNPGSPKHCGLEIVGGSHLPEDWQGNMITNDFRAHRVCRFVVSEEGSGYASRQETELIKTSHVAFRPIDVKMGPDGAIYIADWYNPIIQHGEVDFRDPRRDHTHGRIWRVTAKGRPLVQPPQLEKASIPELLALQSSPEPWNRLQAKLLLKQRAPEAVLPELQRWLAGLDRQQPNYESLRLEGLWIYQTLNLVQRPLLEELLKSADHRIRAAAVRVAADWVNRLDAEPVGVAQAALPGVASAVATVPVAVSAADATGGTKAGSLSRSQQRALDYFSQAVADSHPRVRLEGVRALARIPHAVAAETAMVVLDQPLDRWLDFAAWQTMRDLQSSWLPAVQRGELDFGGRIDRLTFALRAAESPEIAQPLLELVRTGRIPVNRLTPVLTLVASVGNGAELQELLVRAAMSDSGLEPAQRAAILEAMAQEAPRRKVVPAGGFELLTGLLNATDVTLRAAAMRAAGTWKRDEHRGTVERAAHEDAAEPVRLAAIEALAELGGDSAIAVLVERAKQGNLPERQRAVVSLARLAPRLSAEAAVQLLGQTELDPGLVVGELLARREGPSSLTAALAGAELPPDVARLLLRAAQATGKPLPELLAAIEKAGKLKDFRWTLTPDLLSELVADVAAKGDPHRGEMVYRRQQLQCQKCHAIGGAGGLVGPDLVSIGASAQVDYIIESLLAPNAKVKENYHAITILTDQGKLVTGIPIRDGQEEIVVRDAEGRVVTIPKATIEERAESRSLMPDGTVDGLTRTELVDLVRFLSELGKVGDFAVSSRALIRNWETLLPTPAAQQRLRRTSFDTAATNDPELTWQPIYGRISGDLPLEELPLHTLQGNTPPTSFVRFQIEHRTAGPVRLKFHSVTGLALWVDGKPTPIQTDLEVALPNGIHQFVLAIDRTQAAALRIESKLNTE